MLGLRVDNSATSRTFNRVALPCYNDSMPSTDISQTDVPAELSAKDNGDSGSSPKLRALDSNPQGHFGPRCWQSFRDSVAHIYDTVSLPDPSEEARFTLSGR